jgi:hypothetical protein
VECEFFDPTGCASGVKDGKVKHVEYVHEIANEPHGDAVLNAAKAAASA